jgi:hypothetical protein
MQIMKKTIEKFQFDLEKEIKEYPFRGKEILTKAEQRIAEIKKLLREGCNEQDSNQLMVLLHAYAAVLKILRKIPK